MGGSDRVSGEARWWGGALAALVVFVVFMLVVGNLGAPRPEVDPFTVDELLAEGPPADRFGAEELHIVGWYAELDGDCEGDDGGADPSVSWLQRDCPLRILVPSQPAMDVTQQELLAAGVRLAAPLGNVFPSRAEPSGPNLRGQQLVFVGAFDHATTDSCVPDRLERCRNTFVVTDYDEQIR
jgi:hypothetical protein